MISLLVVVGCRPKGVPSPKEMEDVLVDLHITDGVLSEAGLLYNHEDDLKAYYASTLAKHGMTQADFDTALVWYTNHSVQFEKIYPKVQARLEKMQHQMNEAQNGKTKEIKRTQQLTIEQLTHEYLFGLENNWPEPIQRYRINPILLLEKKK